MRAKKETNHINNMARKLAFLFICFGMALPALAANKPITCKTNFGEKSFTIQDNSVAFHRERSDGRSISSVLSARTRAAQAGFKKTLYRDGYKHLISIHNTESFNSDDDFLAVTSPKGHKMTFPINCSLL